MNINNRLILIGLIGILALSNYLSSPTHAVADPTAPTFSSISFDRGIASVGDSVKITVIADDPESGVDYCYIGLYGSLNQLLAGVYMNYNSTTGACTGSFTVNQYWTSFAYASYIEIGNTAGNYSYFYDVTDYTSPIVNFSNTTPDYTAPVFQSISFDRGTALVGDSVLVSVGAVDLESGVEYCYVNLEGSIGEYLTSIYMNYNSTIGRCSGNFEVGQFWSSYAYVSYIELGNNAGNYSYFYDGTDFTSPIVNLSNTTPDFSGPVYQSSWFDSTYVYVGEELTLTVDGRDPESGINYCWAELQGPAGYVSSLYMYYNSTTGYCSGSVTVQDYWPTSVYLSYLEIGNNANNYTYFYNGIDFTSSTVTIDYTDIFAPQVYSEFDYQSEFSGSQWITVDSDEAGYGYVYLDTVQIASLTFASPDDFWFDTTLYQNGDHSLTISVWDYSGNFREYVYNISIRNSNFDIDTYWNIYDNDLNSIDDNVEVQSLFSYDFDFITNVEVVFKVERYDPSTSTYYFYDQIQEDRNFVGVGSEWFYQYYSPYEDGDYRFTIEYYVNYGYEGDYTTVFSAYLEADPLYKSELYLDVFGNDWDQDNDGYSDHLDFVVKLDYYNYPFSNVEVYVEVLLNGVNYDNYSYNETIEGSNYMEFQNNLVATENGNYQFKVSIVQNGELVAEYVYYWDDVRAYNPDHTSDDVSSDNVSSDKSDDVSSTPALPLPAGNIYLFVFSLFAVAITIRRRYQ